MTLLQIAAAADRLRDMTGPAPGVEGAIRAALAGLPPGAPVVVMVHGRGYRPGDTVHCPHRLLYADRTGGDGHAPSWSRRLGLTGPGGGRLPGLAVGFGWDGAGSVWRAARVAEGTAAAGLVRLVTLLRRDRPQAPVDLIGHSLGARVILAALARLHPGAVGRVILMAGAEFVDRAEASLASPAGRLAEVINVTSRENDLFDWLFETALGRAEHGIGIGGDHGNRALGRGLGHLPNAVDVQIDSAAVRAGLAGLGFRLAAPRARICHWSVYLRPGVFPLYRALIHRRSALPLARLRAALEAPPDPRWARLSLPLPRGPRTLPA